MADPTASSVAAALAASGATYPLAVALGIPEALALPIAVAAAAGASWAMANRERVEEINVRTVLSALAAWFFSWVFGVIFGPITAAGVMWAVPDKLRETLPPGSVSVGLALVLSAIAISHGLPLLTKLLDQKAGASLE